MRTLNQAQHAKLDALAEDHPEAKVIGWLGSKNTGGPIFEYRGGYRYVNKWGRVCATRKPRKLTRVNL